MSDTYLWELRSPEGGMLGLEFAYAVTDSADVVLAHALPNRVWVQVRTGDGKDVAFAEELSATEQRPMARLRLTGDTVTREDVWPDASDIGRPVILPGGEVGVLLSWWNADDGSEWRWQVEFYNSTKD